MEEGNGYNLMVRGFETFYRHVLLHVFCVGADGLEIREWKTNV